MSFGKFLEVTFYNASAVGHTGGCAHTVQLNHIVCFGCGEYAARFDYESIRRLGVYVRRKLPADNRFHAEQRVRALRALDKAAAAHFAQLRVKLAALEAIASGAAVAEYVKIVNTPDLSGRVQAHLVQTRAEVRHWERDLQKLVGGGGGGGGPDDGGAPDPATAAARGEGAARGPAELRRELFLRATQWSQLLTAAGRLLDAIAAHKERSASHDSQGGAVDGGGGDALHNLHELVEEQLVALETLRDAPLETRRKDTMLFDDDASEDDGSDADASESGDDESGDDAAAESGDDAGASDSHGAAESADDGAAEGDAGGAGAGADETLPAALAAVAEENDDDTAAAESDDTAPAVVAEAADAGGMPVAKAVDAPLAAAADAPPPPRLQHLSKPPLAPHPTAAAAPVVRRQVSSGRRFTSALARFMGKDAATEDPWCVPPAGFNQGRPQLEPGWGEKVIPVFEGESSLPPS